MAFEQVREHTGDEVHTMLDRLEQRISEKKLDRESTESALTLVADGIAQAKNQLVETFEFNEMDIKEIVDITNPWTAWGRDGILAKPELKELRGNLQKMLDDSDTSLPASAKRLARQMWRTEMVAHMIEKIGESDRADKTELIERVLGAQVVSENEKSPAAALRSAMLLEDGIRDLSVRKELAKKMNEGASGGVTEAERLSGQSVQKIRVLTGGEFIEIPLSLSTALKFKNMAYVEGENRFYGQMENGCKGNLVILDVGTARPPAPTPPPPPGPAGGATSPT